MKIFQCLYEDKVEYVRYNTKDQLSKSTVVNGHEYYPLPYVTPNSVSGKENDSIITGS